MLKRKFIEINNNEETNEETSAIEKLRFHSPIFHNIFSFFSIQEFLNVRAVSRGFQHLTQTYPKAYDNPLAGQIIPHDMPTNARAILVDHTVVMFSTKYSGKDYIDDIYTLSTWNIQTNAYDKFFCIPGDPICMAKLTPHTFIMSFDTSMNMRIGSCLSIWDIETKKTIKTLIREDKDTLITAITKLSDSTVVIASDGKQANLRVFDINNGECVKKHTVECMKPIYPIRSVHSIAKLSDNIIITNLGSVWNIQTGEYKELDIFYDEGIPFENNIILTLEKHTSQLTIYSAKTGECIKKLNYPDGENFTITCMIQLSLDMVALGCTDGIIRLWDIKKDQCLKEWKAHEKDISFMFKLSDNSLISTSSDKTLRFWSFPPKQERQPTSDNAHPFHSHSPKP